MKQITKFEENFDLSSAIVSNNINSLDIFEEYVDFALNTTIKKHMPEISEQLEKSWAGIVLRNYLNGDVNAFTSSFNIRKNISNCGKDKIIQMFLKQAIEIDAYGSKIFHKVNPTNEVKLICENITKKMYSDEYDTVFNIVRTNSVYQEGLINNYINFKYRCDVKNEISKARESTSSTSVALSNLERGMQKSSLKISEEYKK